MASPLISFLIPSYNYGRYLKDCLNSIFNQEGQFDYEVIVVDDASQDNSREIILSYKDARFRTYFHKSNQGHVVTINECFQHARGEFIARIDSDDRYRPTFLKEVMTKFQEHPEVGVIYGNIAMIDKSGVETGNCLGTIHDNKDFKGDELVALLKKNYLPAPTIIARKEAWQTALPIPDGVGFSDWYLSIRMAVKYPFYYINKILADYRIHGEGLHCKMILDHSEEKTILKILEDIFSMSDGGGINQVEKKDVYAENYFQLADKYFGAGMLDDARRCYHLAVRFQNKLLWHPGLFRRWLATYIGTKNYQQLKEYFKLCLSSFKKIFSKKRTTNRKIKQLVITVITRFCLASVIASMSRGRRFPILLWRRLAGLASTSYDPKGSLDTSIPIRDNHEILLRLDLAEDFDRSLYFFGAHERETADFISRRLQSPKIKVFYDIGANIGFYTIMAGKLMQPKQGYVEAFEPIPWIYKRLLQNVEINLLPNIRAHPWAVSERPGTSTIYLPHGNNAFSTNATLDNRLAKTFNSLFASQGIDVAELQIQTESVDALIEKGNILPPHFIHMDIEGEELKALVGMTQTLRTYMPEIILEILPGRHTDIRSFLYNLNYQLYHMGAGKLYSCNDSCIRHSGRDWYAKAIAGEPN